MENSAARKLPEVEELQEYQGAKSSEQRIHKLTDNPERRILRNIIEQVYWRGPVDRVWLEKEIASQEIVEEAHAAVEKKIGVLVAAE